MHRTTGKRDPVITSPFREAEDFLRRVCKDWTKRPDLQNGQS